MPAKPSESNKPRPASVQSAAACVSPYSWPPIEPRCLRWTFPVWTPDDTLDPADLLTARARRRRVRAQAREQSDEPEWTVERFADAFVSTEPQTKAEIIAKAAEEEISARKATRFLREAEEAELIHRWKFGVTKPVQFATEAQSAVSSVRARTPPHTPPAVRAHTAGPEGS